MPWQKPLSKIVDRAVLDKAPEIARAAVEEASARLKNEGREEFAKEIARAMSNQLMPQGPQATYPQVGGSPHPLYGFDNPWRYNVPISPKQRIGSLVSVETLRAFANSYDILRSCINHLKREVQAQAFSIKAKDPKDKSKSTQDQIASAYEFFSKYGGLGEITETRRLYEAKMVEDTMVVGAFASWKSYSKGGKLLQVLNIDASTIRPKMDSYGWPGPGDDWYEQWIMGMLITGFRPEELVYTGLWPETTTPYFRSAVEYLVMTTISALAADKWNQSWLTDGNTPGQMISLPETYSPTQVQEYAELFLAMLAGDSNKRQQVTFVPGGAKNIAGPSRKDQDFSEFELWLARRTGAICGVQLASIGFAGEQYKVSQEKSNDNTSQFGAGAFLDLRKEHYDDILCDLGHSNLEIQNGETAEESGLERAQRLLISMPWTTLDEIRADEGRDPIEGGENILVSSLLQPLERSLNPPDPVQPTEEPKPGQPVSKAKKSSKKSEEMARWMRKSLARVKDGKPALCSFESASIPKDTNARIMRMLGDAETVSDVKAIFRDDEDESEEDPKDKRKKLFALLQIQIDEVEGSLASSVGDLQAGTAGITKFVDDATEALLPHHINAAHLGRLRAGGTGAINASDIQIGTANAASQQEFLRKLAADIQSGSLSDAELSVRLRLFGQRIAGTANQSWVRALPQDASLAWNDEDDASECEDCHRLARGGPYTPETIPTLPGLGETTCRTNCRCFITTSDGETSFYDPEDNV